MDESELLLEAADAHVVPATATFFETFWREAEQRERRSARRWRTVALLCAVVALAAVAAAGVMASSRISTAGAATFDQTWSCASAYQGSGYRFEWRGSVTTPTAHAYLFLTSAPPALTQQLGPPVLRVDTQPGKVIWASARCVRSHAVVPLSSRGLTATADVNTHFIGTVWSNCLSSAHVLVHARVIVKNGGPTSVEAVVANATTRKPFGFVKWSPTRISTWTRGRCDSY